MLNGIVFFILSVFFSFGAISLFSGGKAKIFLNKFMIRKLRKVQLQLEKQQKNIFNLKDIRVLSYFENYLEQLEWTIQKLRNHDFSEGYKSNEALMCYVNDCKRRSSAIDNVLKQKVISGHFDLKKLSGRSSGLFSENCYFCSAPMNKFFFKKAHIIVEGQVSRVHCCNVCSNSLNNQKKVNILHFSEKGVRHHWSKSFSYRPSTEYWLMNKSNT